MWHRRWRAGYFEFAGVALLLVLSVTVSSFQSFSSYSTSALLLSVLVAFSLFVFLNVAYPAPRTNGVRRNVELAQHALFVVSVTSFLLIIVSSGFESSPMVGSVLYTLLISGYFLVLFIPLFFFMFVGASIVRKDSKELRVAAVLFLVAFLILLLYFSSGFLLQRFNINDEEFLQFHAAALTLAGINPYTVSFSNQLFHNASTIGMSLTTSNKIVGTMDYPALYFLSFIPFYAITNPTLANAGRFDVPFQATVYLFLLLLVLAFSLREEELLKPRFVLFVFVMFGVLVTVSVTIYLMLALIMLAYAKMGNKYVWLILGLCVSLQEELWLPVIFLLVYSLNNYGVRKGIRDMAGTLAVFLIINSYFIATAPTAFFASVLTPLNGFYFPSGLGAVGSMFLNYYPVLMSTYTQLFDLAAIAFILLFAYLNKKELVGLFSLLPLLFMVHVLPAYYVFFVFLTFFAFYTTKDTRRIRMGVLSSALHRYKYIFALILALVVIYAAYIVFASHAAYEGNFGISVVNATLVSNPANNASYYSATLLYRNLSNSTLYAYALVYNSHGTYLLGIVNSSIITSPHSEPDCGSYECMVNVNKLELQNVSGSYALTATLDWQNESIPAESAVLVFYNNEYLYLSPAVSAASPPS